MNDSGVKWFLSAVDYKTWSDGRYLSKRSGLELELSSSKLILLQDSCNCCDTQSNDSWDDLNVCTYVTSSMAPFSLTEFHFSVSITFCHTDGFVVMCRNSFFSFLSHGKFEKTNKQNFAVSLETNNNNNDNWRSFKDQTRTTFNQREVTTVKEGVDYPELSKHWFWKRNAAEIVHVIA